MNREMESAGMRPLAKAVTKSLENVRVLLREQVRANTAPAAVAPAPAAARRDPDPLGPGAQSVRVSE